MTKKSFLLLLIPIILLGLSFSSIAFAQEGSGGPCSGNIILGECIVNIYRWALGIAVLIALIMIIISGYRYITAGGNAQTVASAKEMLTGSFVGLILLFAAVLILRTINPDLVDFSKLKNFSKPPVNTSPVNNQVQRAALTGPQEAQEVSTAFNIENAVIDEYGNINYSNSGSLATLSVVSDPITCAKLEEGAVDRDMDWSPYSCAEYQASDPSAMPAALSAAVGYTGSGRVTVVIGSVIALGSDWLLEGGGSNIFLGLDLIQGVRTVADATGSYPSQSVGGVGSGGTGSGGSSVACTLEVFCEDPTNGNRYEPGPSGCQGSGYDGPPGTRQVSECLGSGDSAPSCSAEIRFDFRNCQNELDSIRIDNSADFDYSALPSSRGSAGSLFAVPGINAGSVNILCSYGDDAYEASACGAAMSGGFCEPWFSNPGCIPR